MMVALIQSSVIMCLAICAALIFRRQSAATRHAILIAGLFASLVAPLVPPILPRIHLPERAVLSVPVVESPETSSAMDSSAAGVRLTSGPTVHRQTRWYLWIWLLGVSAFGTVLIAGAARIRGLVLNATPIASPKPHAILEEVAARLRWKRKVELLANRGEVLGTVGILRPKVFLPLSNNDWSDERLRLVLTHELAHIKRFDWPVQVVAEIARAVYWFNPLFWIACRWIRLEGEHACDDVVLNAGFPAESYAAHLLELARTLRDSGRRWSSVLAMSRPPNLERRFVAMLNSSLNHLSVTRRTILAVCVTAACVTLLLTSVRTPAQATPVVSPPVLAAVAGVPGPEPTRLASAAPSKKAAKKQSVAPATVPQGRADGSLFGTVIDSTGAVVPGVVLTVSSVEAVPNAAGRENPVATIVSDEVGNFRFPLPAGRYFLKAELPGFSPFRKTGIEVRASQPTREIVFMTVGTLAERVEVRAVGQPRPPATPNGLRRVRVGGNVVAANLLSQVKPVYPQSARDAGIEGTVHLLGIIGADGAFITLRVVRSNDPDLASAALEAVRQWRYRPTFLNNEPIEVSTEIDVDFKLAQ